MAMRILQWGLMLFVCVGVSVRAAAEPATGESAPALEADSWLNLPEGKKSIKKDDLKGQIIIVEFWVARARECKEVVPHLNSLQDKFKGKGVIILAMTDGSGTPVAKFIKEQKLKCIVGCEATDTMRAYGVQQVPHSYLIDPEGKVVWSGHPAVIEQPLEDLIKSKPATGKGFLFTGNAKSLFKQADGLYKKKKYERALETFEELAKNYAASSEGKESKKKIKAIRGNSRIMAAIKSAQEEREADKWLRAARSLAQYGDAPDSLKYYKRIIDKFPQTKSARFARNEIEPIQKRAEKFKDTDKDKGKSRKAKSDASDDDEDSDDSESDDDSDDSDEDEDSDDSSDE